jgi:hypothetical protein
MSLGSKDIAACGLLGGRNNNILLIVIVIFFLFCGCGGGGNLGGGSGCVDPCCRRRRRRNGIGNVSIIWVVVIFALLAGGNKNTNTNIINLDTDDGSDFASSTTGF